MGLKDYFSFDNEDSSTFGVYASGEATHNAPAKEYDTYEIPGRNGDLEMFNGRYSNITVTYPCTYEMTGGDFSRDISDFRNMLLSKDGYKRLSDTHHPDEYRLGVYKGGLDVNPTDHSLLGTFDVDFDCKPQRFLTSGEAPVSIASGKTITNPTRFPSSPLLMVTGYGTVNMGGQKISIGNYPVGRVNLVTYASGEGSGTVESPYLTKAFHRGDSATVSATFWTTFQIDDAEPGSISRTITDKSDGMIIAIVINQNNGDIGVTVSLANKPFPAGYSGQNTWTAMVKFTYENTNGNTVTATVTISCSISRHTDSVYLESMDLVTYGGITTTVISEKKQIGAGFVNSTMSMLGEPLYIDLDTGNAYKIEDGEYILVNYGVSLGTELPTLKPGVSKITYSNTITDFQIVPRWWKL